MSADKVAEAQALARWQVEHLVRTLRAHGWDFVAVSLWRDAGDEVINGAGSSMFEVSKQLTPSLPRLADNLRVLARELDDAHRASGAPEIVDGYTQVVSGTTVDARAARQRAERQLTDAERGALDALHRWLHSPGGNDLLIEAAQPFHEQVHGERPEVCEQLECEGCIAWADARRDTGGVL